MNKSIFLGLCLMIIGGVVHADPAPAFNPANNPKICNSNNVTWNGWLCESPGTVTLDPITWAPGNKVCKNNSITASTVAHQTDGSRKRAGVDECGFGHAESEPITPTLTGNGYDITGPYAGSGGELSVVLNGSLTGEGTVKFHQDWTTVSPCVADSPAKTPEEKYGVYWVKFIKDKKYRACTYDIHHYGAADNLTADTFNRERLLWTGGDGITVIVNSNSGDTAYSTNQGAYIISAASIDLPACNDSFTLYLLKLVLPDEYLGVNLEDTPNPPHDSIQANVDPAATGVSYAWQSPGGAAHCVYHPSPGDAATATIEEQGAGSSKYRAETVSVEISPLNGDEGFTLTTNFTVVKVDVSVAELGESQEETVGANVPYNNDDDNASVTADKLDYSESGAVVGEDDLQAVKVEVTPDNLPETERINISGGDIFEDNLKERPAAASYPPSAFTSGTKTFYINGRAPSENPLNCTFTASHASGAKDKIKYTTFMVDIQGPALFEDTAMDDHIEEYSANSWGRYVELNDDDDAPVAGNNEWDFNDSLTDRAQDDRIVPLTLEVKPAMLAGSTLDLAWDAAFINVYSGSTKANLTLETPGPMTWPKTLWIEGKKASTAMKDLEMTATYKRDLIGKPSIDKVKLTVCSVDIDGDSDEDGYGGVGSDSDDKVEGNDKYPVGVIYNDDDSDQNMALDNKNQTIDGDADKNQMAEIIVRKVLPDDIPEGVVTLEGAPQVRLFKPDGSVLKDADSAGPVTIAWTNLPLTLKAEGVTPGIGELRVKYVRQGVTLTDHLHVGVFRADLDIDSDNTSDFDGPELTEFEDAIENGCTNPAFAALKYVVVDDYYNAGETNGIPGYATNRLAGALGPVETFEFVPMRLEIFAPFEDPALTTIRFSKLGGGGPAAPPVAAASVEDGETIYTPAGGNYRVWMKPRGDAARNTNSVLRGGDYVPFEVDIPATNFGAEGIGMGVPGSTTLYVEGIRPSLTLGDEAISVQVVNRAYSNRAAQAEDKLKFTVIKVDVDVDSDNNNGFDPPARTLAEDHYEDIGEDTNRTGKMIAVNSDDKDEDGIPDFADGYDLFAAPNLTNDDINTDEQFVPVVFEIPEPIDLSRARVKLDYDDSNPLSVTTNPAGKYVLPSSGSMRLWRQKGNVARNGGAIPSGDFVPKGEYTASDFGFSNGTRTVTLYAEAVKISQKIADKRILFKVQPDERTGFIAADAVRLSAYEFRVVWGVYNSPWKEAGFGALGATNTPVLGGVPGEPGGQGGFGGPPEGSGFTRFVDPFRIEDFKLEDAGASATGRITLKIFSNVSSWSSNFVLTEIGTNAAVYADEEDSLAIRLFDQYSIAGRKSTNAMNMFVASMAFGAQRLMTVYQPPDTNTFESEHLELVVTMSGLPDAGATNVINAVLKSSLMPDVILTNELVETGTNSLVFESGDKSCSVSFVRLTGNGGTNRNDFTATVKSDLLEVSGQSVDAIETAANSLVFRTDALHNSGPPGTGPGAAGYVSIGSIWVPRGLVGLVNGNPLWPKYWPGVELPMEIKRARHSSQGAQFATYSDPIAWTKNLSVSAGNGYIFCSTSPYRAFMLKDDDGVAPVFGPTLYGNIFVPTKVMGGDELRSRPMIFPTPADKVTVLKVESIEASSPKANNSPQTFEGHKTDFGDPCATSNPGQALVVFHKDVRDANFVVQDYDVTLKANVLPTSITADQLTESWAKVNGPTSGSLNRTDTFEVKYQNAKKGGLYKFEFDLGLTGCAKSGANLDLPLGCPDSSGYLNSEFQRYDQWRADLHQRVAYLTISPLIAISYYVAAMNKTLWEMRHSAATYETGDSPCKRWCPNTVTLEGYVFTKDAIGNFAYAFVVGREVNSTFVAQLGGNVAAILQNLLRNRGGGLDDPDDQAQIAAGVEYGKNPAPGFGVYLQPQGDPGIEAMQTVEAKRGWPSSLPLPQSMWKTYPTY